MPNLNLLYLELDSFNFRQSCVYDSIKLSVPVIPEDTIKDTIGAGDSFIAGFLYSLSFNDKLLTCLSSGVM